jgi:hypothetical protein
MTAAVWHDGCGGCDEVGPSEPAEIEIDDIEDEGMSGHGSAG